MAEAKGSFADFIRTADQADLSRKETALLDAEQQAEAGYLAQEQQNWAYAAQFANRESEMRLFGTLSGVPQTSEDGQPLVTRADQIRGDRNLSADPRERARVAYDYEEDIRLLTADGGLELFQAEEIAEAHVRDRTKLFELAGRFVAGEGGIRHADDRGETEGGSMEAVQAVARAEALYGHNEERRLRAARLKNPYTRQSEIAEIGKPSPREQQAMAEARKATAQAAASLRDDGWKASRADVNARRSARRLSESDDGSKPDDLRGPAQKAPDAAKPGTGQPEGAAKAPTGDKVEPASASVIDATSSPVGGTPLGGEVSSVADSQERASRRRRSAAVIRTAAARVALNARGVAAAAVVARVRESGRRWGLDGSGTPDPAERVAMPSAQRAPDRSVLRVDIPESSVAGPDGTLRGGEVPPVDDKERGDKNSRRRRIAAAIGTPVVAALGVGFGLWAASRGAHVHPDTISGLVIPGGGTSGGKR